MNKDDLTKKLEHLDLPEIELQSHKRRLKIALLNSGYFKEHTAMSLLKKFAPVGVIAAVAVIAIVGIVSLSGSPSQASAQEIAKKTYQTIVNLPADQQAKISGTLGFDSRTALEEAMKAKDLKALTYDEFANSNPLPPDPDGKLRTLKFLQYTNTDGASVIIGVDQNNMPVFGSVKFGGANPAGAYGEKSFQTMTNTSEEGLVNCTIENGVEKCTKVSE